MIRAEVTADGDDYGPAVEFDATKWFERATDSEIDNLSAEEYYAGDASDSVAEFAADYDNEVGEFFRYLDFRNRHSKGSGGGFSCRVSEKDAEAWIAENRPHLAQQSK